ncbi:MAG: class I SAM-dependent methyltransferase [Prolixibacteraceae bacterium]|jgi:2-polyprenyl-3-methyl-5-hydroxy-6-metoxy-1,4-benzoquinol methylase
MSEVFYSNIAKYYPQIFPFNPAQINFLRTILPYNGAKVLDVGCATGDLTFALTHFGFPVWAFDFDSEMVEIARKAKQEDAMFPVIDQLDMRQIESRYPESFFHTVICFGNTLVHLLNDEDIRLFIRSAHKVLAPEGKLTIQILNYNHILDHRIQSLPVIENEHIRFERNYEFVTDDLIDFHTKLLVKATNQEISDSVKLHPIRKEKLEQFLLDDGFKELTFIGNFNGESLGKTSLPLIVTGQKPNP